MPCPVNQPAALDKSPKNMRIKFLTILHFSHLTGSIVSGDLCCNICQIMWKILSQLFSASLLSHPTFGPPSPFALSADAAMLDEETKTDLINFSYNLCIGNMDEAFRSVKKVAGNSSIWENMAHMCVKTQVRVWVVGG